MFWAWSSLLHSSSQRASHRWFPAPNTLSPCSVRGFLFMGLGHSLWHSSSQRASHRWFPAPNTQSPCSVRGFLFMGLVIAYCTAVLSECRTTGFPLQIHKPLLCQGFFVFGYSSSQRASHRWILRSKYTKAPALSGIFILGTTGLSERRTADIPIRAH